MNGDRRRIYLDNAATSYPKPESVYVAVDHYQRNLGGAVGRGTTQVGSQIQQTVDRTRKRIATFLGLVDPTHIILTLNGTDSLNLVLHGFLNAGEHVIVSPWEHNSVLRPLESLSREKQIQVTHLDSTANGTIDLDQYAAMISPKTKLVCITHASNVSGVIQPIADVIEIAHQAGARVLLDAAQTVGHLPLSMKDLDVDFLACPGHKGLLAPLGTGILAIKPGLADELQSTRQGGTGTTSELASQPETLPEKYESGNHNAPGIFGLEAAANWLETESLQKIHLHEQQLTQLFIDGLQRLPGMETYLCDEDVHRIGLLSLNATRLEPQVLSTLLDEHFGIETRAGLHCAPRAHAALGTLERGGTVRFSFGPFNTTDDIDQTLEALGQISSAC